jgi:hypothetical protein
MASLQRTSSGAYKSRKRIPDDVRADYKRLYGQALEAKFYLAPGATEGRARQRHAEWLAEHEGRVKAIRAAQRGEGIDLTPKDALGLAGAGVRRGRDGQG